MKKTLTLLALFFAALTVAAQPHLKVVEGAKFEQFMFYTQKYMFGETPQICAG